MLFTFTSKCLTVNLRKLFQSGSKLLYFTFFFLLFFFVVRPRFTQPAKMRKRVIARPVGSSVRLKCTASGNPRPDIVWMKDSRPLTPEEVGEGRKKKWTLSLKNLTPEHSGKYTCHVSNRAGEINATYKVEVIRKSTSFLWCFPGMRLSFWWLTYIV